MKQTIKKAKALFLSLAVLLAAGLSAETLTVSSNLDSGDGTLRQLIEICLDGDSIVIPADYTIVLQSEIAFDKSLAINGQGALVKVTETGVSNWRLFMVGTTSSTPKVVSMHNLRLEGGNVSSFTGGAGYGGIMIVRRNHTFTMKNCSLSKGKATYAGGLFTHEVIGTTVILEGCTFNENECTVGNGGALILRGFYKVDNCVFTNNVNSGLNGGAISVYDNTPGCMISNSRFIGNSSHAPSGGAIINYSTTNSVDLENCTFEGNINTAHLTYTTGAGGFATGNPLSKSTLTNCTFYNNIGTTAGAVYNNKGALNLVNCTFAGNSTPSAVGGGAYHDVNHADSKTTMVNNLFAYNYNSAGLSDVVIRPASKISGTNNLIGVISGEPAPALLNTTNYNYDYGYPLFANYTETGDKKPLIETNGTISLAVGSVAIGAGLKTFGDPELVPLKDQLGVVRPSVPSVGSVELVISSIKDIEAIQLTITLDPSSRLLTINGDSRIDRVDFIDMSGRRTLSVNNPMGAISLNGLSNGIYLAHIYTSKGEAVKKISIN